MLLHDEKRIGTPSIFGQFCGVVPPILHLNCIQKGVPQPKFAQNRGWADMFFVMDKQSRKIWQWYWALSKAMITTHPEKGKAVPQRVRKGASSPDTWNPFFEGWKGGGLKILCDKHWSTKQPRMWFKAGVWLNVDVCCVMYKFQLQSARVEQCRGRFPISVFFYSDSASISVFF